jgi:hypothetical protein
MGSRHARRTRILLGAVLAASLLVCCGCASTRATLATSAAAAHGTRAAELDFLDALETQPVATNDDVLHILLLAYSGSEEVPGTFPARLQATRELGWLPAGLELQPYESARIGDVAVAVCALLGERGGLTMHVLGRSRRYCTRELVYLGVLPMRTEAQSLSGAELIDLVGRVDDRRAAREPDVTSREGGA